MKIDYCIIGLGNPGIKYQHTRHNFGFMVIDKLAKFFKITAFKPEANYFISKAEHEGKTIILLKPASYMNLSGEAVKEFLSNYDVDLNSILVVYDDVNIDYGTIRIRPAGSDGGQNGIKSIIYELETDEFARMRMGIRVETEIEKLREKYHNHLAEYVLSKFSIDEEKNLNKMLNLGRDAALSFTEGDLKLTMNKFNKNFLIQNNITN